MDLLEYLISILGEDEGKKAYDKISKDKENTLLVQNNKEPSYVEKKLYDELENDNKTLKKTNKKHEEDLRDLKKDLKDNKELQEKIETLEKENSDNAAAYEKEKAEIRYNYELNAAIEKSGAKNCKAILGMLDKEKIKLVNNTLVGLDEQIKSLKESDSYLFKDYKPAGTSTLEGQTIDSLRGKSGKDNSNPFVDSLLSNKKAEKESSEKLDDFFK
ncbi:phage scaffolding protein [Peptostreptococcus sp. D1]|uniref:phage scaffolding protein n=1 Tax=Peptostreptococcus sp. D1 TaxID=72304 RepID=UPI0008E422E8|nr:phage scaffolding protein [Peptostreptococcus sp. D1]SFE91874.1 Phage minor structural protein GP20 [Peptostreptococcus sp. D1]